MGCEACKYEKLIKRIKRRFLMLGLFSILMGIGLLLLMPQFGGAGILPLIGGLMLIGVGAYFART